MYEGIMKYNWDRFGDGLGGFIEEKVLRNFVLNFFFENVGIFHL